MEAYRTAADEHDIPSRDNPVMIWPGPLSSPAVCYPVPVQRAISTVDVVRHEREPYLHPRVRQVVRLSGIYCTPPLLRLAAGHGPPRNPRN